MPSELVELLRRCHRAEIAPLAELLGLHTEGVGLGDLALRSERMLRLRGSNQLASLILRRGDGPAYDELLRALATHLGLPPKGDVEALEQAIAAAAMRDTLRQLTTGDRVKLLTERGLDPTLADEAAALALLRASPLLPAKGLRAGVLPFAVAGLPLVLIPGAPPAIGCLFLFWLARPRYDLLLPALVEVASLRRRVRHRVTVGVVGSPSSGKDAALKAIFGVDTGNVNPVAGSTKSVEITQMTGSEGLFLVNTPGMGDVIEAVTEEARQVLELIDVFVYVLNAQGGVQAREKADYRACVARGRPVLVAVNKIDTLKEGDRARYLSDAQQKLGANPEDFVAAAFDPLPQLMDAPLGVEPTRAWIERHLVALGKQVDGLPWRLSQG